MSAAPSSSTRAGGGILRQPTRAGWGLGNALFIATALAAIVGAASGGVDKAIILYESALGLGISTGPLLGGVLGGISWRGPFFGVAALMAIAFILVAVLLPRQPRPARHTTLADPFRALRHRGLLTMGVTALFYNFGFFTLLAYTPFPLGLSAHGLGAVFFGWGVCVAATSVFAAPRLQARFGTVRSLAVVLVAIAVVLVVMGVAHRLPGHADRVCDRRGPVPRGQQHPGHPGGDAGRSGGTGGGVGGLQFRAVRWRRVAPFLAGKLAALYDPHVPFFVGAAGPVIAVVVLTTGRRHLHAIDTPEHDTTPAAAPQPAATERREPPPAGGVTIAGGR